MLDDWFRIIELNITVEEFQQLPRSPAYKQEYYGGRCVLTPRPKGYHAVLDLCDLASAKDAPPPVHQRHARVRPLREEDWDILPEVLAAAFHRVSPFCSLDNERREHVAAARDCLQHTRGGGDGPFISRASFIAVDERDNVLGALLVTLWPQRELTDWSAAKWPDPPPADAVERRLGRPHLTWVFVSPLHAGHGIGTAMLHAAGAELRAMGFNDFATTFMSGNDSSMLWHWRNGFRLLPYPGSLREIRRGFDEKA